MLALALAMPILVDAGCKAKEAPSERPKKAERERGIDVVLSPAALAAAGLTVTRSVSERRGSSVTVAGMVDFSPSHVARVGPSLSGRVGQVLVSPGQEIRKGHVVATVDGVAVGRARGDWSSARSRLDMALTESAREEKMFAAGASSERSLQAARTEKRLADAELRAADARLATFGVRGSDGAVSSTVPLVSPIAGVVLEVKARVGQPVGATDTLVVVGETSEVWLIVDVYERDLSKVQVGDDVRVTAIAFPDNEIRGRVDDVENFVDPDCRVMRARIVLPNLDGKLKPGMSATARVLGASQDGDGGALDVIIVPRGAIQVVDGAPFVFVEQGQGKFEMRAVERGQELGTNVQILRGLLPGEPVVSKGSLILKSQLLRAQMGLSD